MAVFRKISQVSEIPDGKMKEFRIGDKVITVANTDGEFLAFDGICTHAHCSLAGGYLDGFSLTCYCHGAMFDISTGEVLAPPAPSPINVYKVKVEGKEILVEI